MSTATVCRLFFLQQWPVFVSSMGASASTALDPSAAAPALPAGWESCFHPATGRNFYYDHNTRRYSWIHPSQLQQPAATTSQPVAAAAAGSRLVPGPAPPTPSVLEEALRQIDLDHAARAEIDERHLHSVRNSPPPFSAIACNGPTFWCVSRAQPLTQPPARSPPTGGCREPDPARR